MLPLGTVWIGKYKAWITTPVFSLDPLDPKARELPYFEVLVTREEDGRSYYVNLNKDPQVRFAFDMSERNPLFHPKDKENITADELEFREEFNSYQHRKDQGMPLTKLSARHVEMLLGCLIYLSGDCT